jgi:hypothetical protein
MSIDPNVCLFFSFIFCFRKSLPHTGFRRPDDCKQNQNQNQNQFYFRADVKTLKQHWATIGDRRLQAETNRVRIKSNPIQSNQIKSNVVQSLDFVLLPFPVPSVQTQEKAVASTERVVPMQSCPQTCCRHAARARHDPKMSETGQKCQKLVLTGEITHVYASMRTYIYPITQLPNYIYKPNYPITYVYPISHLPNYICIPNYPITQLHI